MKKGSQLALKIAKKAHKIKWLEGLEREALVNLAKQLGKTIKDIGDQLDLVRE